MRYDPDAPGGVVFGINSRYVTIVSPERTWRWDRRWSQVKRWWHRWFDPLDLSGRWTEPWPGKYRGMSSLSWDIDHAFRHYFDGITEQIYSETTLMRFLRGDR